MDEEHTEKQTEQAEQAEADDTRAAAEKCYDWISSLVGALVVVAFVFAFLFRIATVSGESMTDTLQNGDRIVMVSLFYRLDRGDIVIINRHNDEPLVKRVIALAGDTIEFDDETGKITLNGVVQEESYVRGGHTGSFECETPYTVPEGCFFAMGDNRDGSKDSRMLGAFSVEDVAGVAVLRLFPLGSFGRIGNVNG